MGLSEKGSPGKKETGQSARSKSNREVTPDGD